MIAEAWQTRVEGPLVFHFQPESYAQDNLEPIVRDYRAAFEQACAFLSLAPAAQEPIAIRLCQVLTAADGQTAPPEIVEAGPDEIRTCANSETAEGSAVFELTRLLLVRQAGAFEAGSRFWYDGLAGYLAGKQGGSTFHAEAESRMRKLFEAGQLPPLTDLLAVYGIRQSGTGVSTATALVGFLLERYGVERFKRLLAMLRQEPDSAFRRVYGLPLQSLEQAWYRYLETSSAAGSAGLLDAMTQLLPYLKRYRLQLIGILLCILVAIAFTAFLPMAIRFLVNNILSRRPLPFTLPGIGEGGMQLAIGEQQIHALLQLLAAMVVMFALFAFTNMRRSYLVASMGEGVTYDLRLRLFNHLQRLPIAFHRRTPNQDIQQRFMQDIATIAQSLTFGVVPMVHSALAMLIFGVVLVSLNWKLSLIALAGLPVFAVSFQRSRARMRDNARERTRRVTDVAQSLVQTLNAQEKVKLFPGLRDYLTTRFVNRLQLLRELVVKITENSSSAASTSMLITNAAQVAVLVYGGMLVIESQGRELATGDLMAFYVLLLQLYAPAGQFTASMQYVNQATTSLDRISGIMNQEQEQDPPEAHELGPLKEAIRFDAVGYGRGKGKDVLSGLSLVIPAGQKVAFVGPPGAGKASLMELLPRLFDVASGAILWDGTDLRQASMTSLRRELAVLPQDTFVFNATIYDNIRYGRVAASDQEVIEASRRAGLHDFIVSLPGGYDTQINDRDSTFGLVQRQRLGAARVLLQAGSVILMDDAVTALDANGQREIERVLRGPSGKTLIRVAQRIGSILDADLIYVLDGGQLVEHGRHDDLAEAGGLYTQMLKDELGAGAVSGAFQAVRRLAKQAPFSSLPPEVLEEVARLMLYAERSSGDLICRQGSVGDELYFIGRGEVQILLEDEDGSERLLNTLHEGEYFGEISFLRRIPRTATVRARTSVELHVLKRQDFDDLLERLGGEITAELDRTAQERIEMTRAKLAAAEAAPV
jgi:ABC-type multidrug transport system fused ATPase/permease subunit